MIARAGALDQGNIGLNLADAKRRGLSENILFLAGSAINSIKDVQGKPDARIGTEAMQQAIELYNSGLLQDIPIEQHLTALYAAARSRQDTSLLAALEQRYPGQHWPT
jgi:hypothetical protein